MKNVNVYMPLILMASMMGSMIVGVESGKLQAEVLQTESKSPKEAVLIKKTQDELESELDNVNLKEVLGTKTEEISLDKKAPVIKLAGGSAGNLRVATITQLTTDGDYGVASWSPDGKYLLTSKDEMIIINVETGTRTNLGVDALGRWSPDGKKILYREVVKENNKASSWICVMNSDGTNKKRLRKGGSNPSWSPDGKKIVFEAYEKGKWCLKVMNIDGTDETIVVEGPESFWNPIWLPSGRIVYTQEGPKENRCTIYTINPDGTKKRVLEENVGMSQIWWFSQVGKSKVYYTKAGEWLSDEDGNNKIQIDSGKIELEDFSPDGTKFVGTIGEMDKYQDYIVSGEVCIMNIDGSEKVQLTYTPDLIESWARWSPDGDKIVYGDYTYSNLYLIKLTEKR